MSGQVGLPSPNKRHIFLGDAISFTNKRDMFQCISDLISKNYEKLFNDFFLSFHCSMIPDSPVAGRIALCVIGERSLLPIFTQM